VLRTRLATAAVAIPVLWCFVQLLWAPAFAAFILLVIAVGAAEYGWMAFPDAPRVRALTVVGAVGVALGTMAGGPWSEVALATAFLAAVVSPLALPANLGDGLRRAAVAWFGVVYVGFLTAHVVVLRNSSAEGWRWVLFTIFVGMASDTGGYFGGRWFGRRKLFPAVSPSKTVEGALGSVVGALVLALLSRAVFFDRAGTLEALGVAIVVSVLGQCGDLAESALKRAFGAKDSGWIVPGHGGILDRLDSLLLPVVFVWIWVVVAGR
jgi:phosphatidate cytidylyltransferase